jgi:hypothetical protein
MNIEQYFRSIALELRALQDRVRHMIGDAHWPTDGEWKESILRNVIRRAAPMSVSVGRGFVVSGAQCTTQLDILIHDNSHPVLYRDGDLVFVSPAACLGIIEVKSRVDLAGVRAASARLANAARFIRSSAGGHRTFVGLFSYELDTTNVAAILELLNSAAAGSENGVIDHVTLGGSKFVKWWHATPNAPFEILRAWHSYELSDLAAGYFVHNLLMHISPAEASHAQSLWFPEQSKEFQREASRALSEA